MTAGGRCKITFKIESKVFATRRAFSGLTSHRVYAVDVRAKPVGSEATGLIAAEL